MLKALRRYAKTLLNENQDSNNLLKHINEESVKQKTPPIIWEAGNIDQIRSLLVLREAELILAKSQLTGNQYNDWSTHNRIRDLEIKIADLRRWLNDAGREDSNSLGI